MSLFGAGSFVNDLVQLMVVAFVVVSAIANFIKRKTGPPETGGDEPQPAPHPGASKGPPVLPSRPGPRPQKPIDWQEELRRLLVGETEAPPAPPPIRPRQVRVMIEPTMAGPEEVAGRPLATLAESQAAYQQARQMDAVVGERVEQRGALAQAASAYQQASQLDQQVAVRLHSVTSRPVQPTTVVRRTLHSAEISQTRALFRHPATARQAVIAAVILGPAPGLDI